MARKKMEPGEIVPFRAFFRGGISPFKEMESMLEDFMGRRFGLWPEDLSPAVDVYEDENDVVLKAELPGMDKKDLSVDITETTITISGEKKKEEKVEKKDYVRLERSSGSFSRSFTLPVEVRSEETKATFKNGILVVRIPKAAGSKKKKKVRIE